MLKKRPKVYRLGNCCFSANLANWFVRIMCPICAAYLRVDCCVSELALERLIYVVCICLYIVGFNAYCVVFLLLLFVCLSSSCVLCTLSCQFLWTVHS